MEKTQREYYLNEQMKAIQKELGDEEGRDELQELEEKIKKTKLLQGKPARRPRTSSRSSARCRRCCGSNRRAATISMRSSIPWGKKSKVKKDLGAAEMVLDTDHYGLEKSRNASLSNLARATAAP